LRAYFHKVLFFVKLLSVSWLLRVADERAEVFVWFYLSQHIFHLSLCYNFYLYKCSFQYYYDTYIIIIHLHTTDQTHQLDDIFFIIGAIEFLQN